MADVERSFGFSEIVIDDLTNGDCWSLAGILHQRTGLPFAAIYGDGEIVHVGIELAGSLVVDVEGIWDSVSWETHWMDKLEDVWEVYVGFVSDECEEKDALLGYSPSLELITFGGEELGSIADKIVANILSYQKVLT